MFCFYLGLGVPISLIVALAIGFTALAIAVAIVGCCCLSGGVLLAPVFKRDFEAPEFNEEKGAEREAVVSVGEEVFEMAESY